MLYPLVLKPVFKEYLWGGTNLKKIYGADSTDTIAESWVLSCHPEGVTTIVNGRFAGERLDAYIRGQDNGVLGKHAEMPLLIKLIDAADNLSIQVHPDDCYAAEREKQPGKKELWYIVDCEPDSSLFYGFNKKVLKKEFIKRAKDGSVLEVLNQVPVRQGDVFFIESGVVHAIGKGMTIAEIGSNCNITYRIFDFFRKDKTGKPRPLHLEKAAEVAVLDMSERHTFDENGFLNCVDFAVQEIKLNGSLRLTAGCGSFHSLLGISGSCRLEFDGMHVDIEKGTSLLIPAGMGEYSMQGNAVLLKTTV